MSKPLQMYILPAGLKNLQRCVAVAGHHATASSNGKSAAKLQKLQTLLDEHYKTKSEFVNLATNITAFNSIMSNYVRIPNLCAGASFAFCPSLTETILAAGIGVRKFRSNATVNEADNKCCEQSLDSDSASASTSSSASSTDVAESKSLMDVGETATEAANDNVNNKMQIMMEGIEEQNDEEQNDEEQDDEEQDDEEQNDKKPLSPWKFAQYFENAFFGSKTRSVNSLYEALDKLEKENSILVYDVTDGEAKPREKQQPNSEELNSKLKDLEND